MRKLTLIFLLFSVVSQAQFTWDQVGKVKTKNDQFGQAIGAWKLVLNVADSGLYILTEKRNATDSLQTAFRLNKFRALKYSTSTSGVDTVNVVATKYDLTQIGGADYDSIHFRKSGGQVALKVATDTLQCNYVQRFNGTYGYIYNTKTVDPLSSRAWLFLYGFSGQNQLGAKYASATDTGTVTMILAPVLGATQWQYDINSIGTYSYQLDANGFKPTAYAGTSPAASLGTTTNHWRNSYIDTVNTVKAVIDDATVGVLRLEDLDTHEGDTVLVIGNGAVFGTTSYSQNIDALQDTVAVHLDTLQSHNTRLKASEPKITAGTTGQYWRGDKSWQTLNAAAVGLGNVTNTAQVTSVTGSGVISSSGGTTPAISLSTSGASNGYSMRYISNAWRPWPDSTAAGGSMTYPGAGIPVSTGSAWGTSITGTNNYSLRYISGAWRAWPDSTESKWTASGSNIYYSLGNVGVKVPPLHPLHVHDATSNYIDLLVDKESNGRGAYSVLRGYTSDAATVENDTLGVYGFSGQYTDEGEYYPGAITAGVMGIAASENPFSSTAQGTALALLTTPVNDTTMVECVRVTAAGKVGIGTSTPAEKLEVAGSVKLSGNAKFDNSPDSDHTGSGQIIPLTAGATNGIGDVIYIASTGKTALCKADAIANCPYALAICVDASVSADATGNYLTHGSVRDDTWNWTVGGLIYISTTGTTGNTLTQTAPSSANNVIIPVGVALSADVLFFFGNLNTVEKQ